MSRNWVIYLKSFFSYSFRSRVLQVGSFERRWYCAKKWGPDFLFRSSFRRKWRPKWPLSPKNEVFYGCHSNGWVDRGQTEKQLFWARSRQSCKISARSDNPSRLAGCPKQTDRRTSRMTSMRDRSRAEMRSDMEKLERKCEPIWRSSSGNVRFETRAGRLHRNLLMYTAVQKWRRI